MGNEVRKGYKEVRIGPKKLEIPREWKVSTIEDICETYAGGTPRRSNEEYYEGNIPWVKSGELNQNYIDEIEECITQKGLENSSAKWVPSNNVLVAMYGATAGQVGFLRTKATTNQAVLALLPKDNLCQPLFLYQTLSLNMNILVAQRTQGSGQQNLNQTLIREMEIPLPPSEEQKKIATILSSVDKAIEKTDEIIDETKRLKKGLMQELLIKGIDHEEFKEVKIGPKEIKIPIEWELYNLNQICEISGGYAFKSKKFIEDKCDKSYQVIRMGNVKMSFLDINKNPVYLHEDKLSERAYNYLLKKRDILITLTGTVSKRDYGNVVIIEEGDKYLLNQRIGHIQVNDDRVDNRYCYYYLQTKVFRDRFFLDGKGGTGKQENISINDVKNMEIPLPPIKEQKRIAKILSFVENKINKRQEYKESLEQLKKGLMQKLLTGEVRVEC
ncbi:type I restriction enzyme, S subunit [Selenihalanaerobacter shriftii]|uniref:Type I restriction enzyme, S subunit n=2 Tax=Selenihalanaerobacter shriftii TaxID=142842 RepID=A0A1T4NU45_9FIRM|nr:type I restriction enzyme, S subunit [Selenihalanaerobacter shriftii]